MAALVIGNANYPVGNDLTNPINDATDLAEKLKGYGFYVILATDCTASQMDKKLKEFRGVLKTHEVGLFFFAGHGVQIEGTNYLIALDTDMESETDAKHSSLSLDKVVDVLAGSPSLTKIIILDACRKNPWKRAWCRGPALRGLASVYAPKGTIIGFATSPGEVAFDGDGRNGTYTAALLQHIDTPDCSIETMFKRVRNTVAAASGGKQTSWEHTSLSGEFYFNLSLGNLIEEYDNTALADRLFVLDPSKKSHKIIAGLKTHNWYKQNPALAELDATSASHMAKDSLFVLGRNIYQAACGGANDANSFVKNFLTITQGYEEDKRKALLDGMLFEVFFDPNGTLRNSIKEGCFDELFELQQYSELKDSFDFIAEALVASHANFYVVPGKGHELSATVSAKKNRDGELFVDAVYVNGVDVLRAEEDAWDNDDGQRRYGHIDSKALNEKLAVELVVPARLLKITYTPKEAERTEELLAPIGWTVRKA